MRKNGILRKGMAVVLAAAMVFGVPVAVQKPEVVKAATMYTYDFTSGSLVQSGGSLTAELSGEGASIAESTGVTLTGNTTGGQNMLTIPGIGDEAAEAAEGVTISINYKYLKEASEDDYTIFQSGTSLTETEGDVSFATEATGSLHGRAGASTWIDMNLRGSTLASGTEGTMTFTFDSSSGELTYYIDGVKTVSGTLGCWGTALPSSNFPVFTKNILKKGIIIGGPTSAASNNMCSKCFNGIVKSVKICDYAMTAGQVSTLVNGVDYSSLSEAIAAVDSRYSADYTADFGTALSAAKAALSSDSQDEIDSATETLKEATTTAVLLTAEDNDLSDGLVGCYDFDENVTDLVTKKDASKVTVKDITLSDNDDTEFQYDNGVQLGDYGLKLPTTIQDVTNYTVSIDAKFGSSAITNENDQSIFSIQALGKEVGAPREVLYVGFWDRVCKPAYLSEINSETNGWNWVATSDTAIVKDTDYNIILRKEENKVTIYINGAKVASGTSAESKVLDAALNFFLGANSWSTVNMNVSDCEIYNRCLSTPEITALASKKAEEIYVDYIRSTENVNNFYNISSCRGETYEAPEAPEGKIFAGWYKEKACNSASAVDKDTKTGYAYAKFVDDDFMDVKFQKNTTKDDQYRIMIGVDSTDYESFSFAVKYGDSDPKSPASPCKTVYQKVMADGKQLTAADIWTGVAGEESFVAPCVVNGVSGSIEVTPSWVTADGTTVTGSTQELDLSVADNVNAGA